MKFLFLVMRQQLLMCLLVILAVAMVRCHADEYVRDTAMMDDGNEDVMYKVGNYRRCPPGFWCQRSKQGQIYGVSRKK